MRAWEFAASRALPLCFLGAGYLALSVFLLLWGLPGQVWLSVSILFAAAVALWLAVTFILERRRLRRLHRMLDGLEETYLAGELLPRPFNGTERLYFELMKRISRSAIEQTGKARREKEEYMEYVESWIHELKTPLTACTLMLDNRSDPAGLRRELKRAENLTDNILCYARLRTPWTDLKTQKTDLREAADEAVKSQASLLIAAGIRVEISGEGTVETDRKNLIFMIRQFLLNCARYCPGCTIRIRIRDGEIRVEDDGIGIPDYEVDRVTERGFTGSNGRRLGNSTGMGLYLVKGLCDHMGIGLSICSRVGEGTQIALRFPGAGASTVSSLTEM